MSGRCAKGERENRGMQDWACGVGGVVRKSNLPMDLVAELFVQHLHVGVPGGLKHRAALH